MVSLFLWGVLAITILLFASFMTWVIFYSKKRNEEGWKNKK